MDKRFQFVSCGKVIDTCRQWNLKSDSSAHSNSLQRRMLWVLWNPSLLKPPNLGGLRVSLKAHTVESLGFPSCLIVGLCAQARVHQRAALSEVCIVTHCPYPEGLVQKCLFAVLGVIKACFRTGSLELTIPDVFFLESFSKAGVEYKPSQRSCPASVKPWTRMHPWYLAGRQDIQGDSSWILWGLFARHANRFQWHRVFCLWWVQWRRNRFKARVFEGKCDDCHQIQRVSGNPAATNHLRVSIRSTQGRTDWLTHWLADWLWDSHGKFHCPPLRDNPSPFFLRMWHQEDVQRDASLPLEIPTRESNTSLFGNLTTSQRSKFSLSFSRNVAAPVLHGCILQPNL